MSLATSTLKFRLDRVSSILKSFRTLYTLPQEKVDAFLSAYCIFDHDWAYEDEMRRKMGDDYYSEVKRKLVDYYGVLNHLCSLGQIEKMYIPPAIDLSKSVLANQRSEEHTSELQSRFDLVCRLLLEKKKNDRHHRLFSAAEEHDATRHDV